MTSLIARIRDESGQAFVFVAFALIVLVGMAALVVDVGSWFQADRQAQTAADAAALAGAQELPDRWDAEDWAGKYLSKNPDPSTTGSPIEFPDPGEPAYQITVKVTRRTNGFFAKVFGIDSVKVAAEAQAQVRAPLNMKNIAPIAVKDTAACFVTDPDCFNKEVPVDLNESQISSNLDGWIDLSCHNPSVGSCGSGGGGAGELKAWIEEGYPDALPSEEWYGTRTGGKNGIENALENVVGERLFIPVWDEEDVGLREFHIIGWAAFVIHPGGIDFEGQSKKLTGHFETFIATDLAAGGTISDPTRDLGVHVITLTK